MSIYPERNGMKFYCAVTFHCSKYLLVILPQMSEINHKFWICFKKVALRNDPVVLGRSAWFFAPRKASLVWEPLCITDCTQIGWFL